MTAGSVTASMSLKSVTLRRTRNKKLTRGSYRVVARVGAASRSASFRVK
jgi:hypothetical protein